MVLLEESWWRYKRVDLFLDIAVHKCSCFYSHLKKNDRCCIWCWFCSSWLDTGHTRVNCGKKPITMYVECGYSAQQCVSTLCLCTCGHAVSLKYMIQQLPGYLLQYHTHAAAIIIAVSSSKTQNTCWYNLTTVNMRNTIVVPMINLHITEYL